MILWPPSKAAKVLDKEVESLLGSKVPDFHRKTRIKEGLKLGSLSPIGT